jgi:carbamoyltransferase
MKILGITTQNHDASLALVNGNRILWAGHAERYSRNKNDSVLNQDIVNEMLTYGIPDKIVFFEDIVEKSWRKWRSKDIPWNHHALVKDELRTFGLLSYDYNYVKHHRAHAAGGFYTSGFNRAVVLCVDAIGERDTTTIWRAENGLLEKTPMFRTRYPNSIGLFYSALTDYLGLKPNEEEYIFMGMAAFGKIDPAFKQRIKDDFFKSFHPPYFQLRHDLHKGCRWWRFQEDFPSNNFDVAACVQSIVEDYLLGTIKYIKRSYNWSSDTNFVFMGGVALNCVANSKIANLWKNVHIMPNPGDSGSAIGAIASYLDKPLIWKGPYLGTKIDGPLDVRRAVDRLLEGEVIGVAKGRAEFGPRALGNRSLLCDPRGKDAKERMNKIKKREQFRPFAPAILAEHARDFFIMPVEESPYMQFVAKCKRPDLFPAICHVDNSSRVQTVNNTTDNKVFRDLLDEWYKQSGCPMLMNTSLNIKGEPLVNTWEDAIKFEKLHGIEIF